MNEENKLLPCPFCGSDDIDESFSLGYAGGDKSNPLVATGCMECSATGPDYPTTEKAIAAWNKRASEWVSVETAKELEQVLTACKTKLQVYRSHNNGIYHGGMEHTALIKLIENTYERICKPVLEPPKGDE